MNKRWLVNKTNPEYVMYLSRAASISPLLSQVLINRGIKTANDVSDFLYPGLTNLSDPFELHGMKQAVKRIKAALCGNERVLIHGDYDADGLTAAAIMVSALRTAGADVRYFIPNRIIHGYGFNVSSVEAAKKAGIKLIITVDCGITSFDAAEHAKKFGIDLIITDHHEPAKQQWAGDKKSGEIQDSGQGNQNNCEKAGFRDLFLLPDATAVINPKLQGIDSGVSNLSGAGVAFKVAQALAVENGLSFSYDDSMRLLDLATLGTLADIVPLTGENRVIIKHGLKYISNPARPGIKALKEVSGIDKRELKTRLLLFTLVPRINAAGRISDATAVVDLLLSDSYEEAAQIAEMLDKTNAERQRIEEDVYRQAIAQLNAKGHDAAIILYGKGWHVGVTGIVASRVAEEFRKPTFIFSIEDETAKGSARSIPSFDLYNSLLPCKDLLLSFGGHKQAAGVRLDFSKMPLFEERVNAIVKDALEKEEAVPVVEIDSEVNLKEVNENLAKEFSMLEPIGYGNAEPVLGSKRLGVSNPRIVGGNHLKMRLNHGLMSIDAIGFGMAGLFERVKSAMPIDAAFTPSINEWNNSRYMQLNLKALRFSR